MDRKRWKHSAHRLVLHLALQPQPPFAALMPPARPPVLSVCEQTAIGPSHTGCPLPQLLLSYRLGSRKSAPVTHGSEGPDATIVACDADWIKRRLQQHTAYQERARHPRQRWQGGSLPLAMFRGRPGSGGGGGTRHTLAVSCRGCC